MVGHVLHDIDCENVYMAWPACFLFSILFNVLCCVYVLGVCSATESLYVSVCEHVFMNLWHCAWTDEDLVSFPHSFPSSCSLGLCFFPRPCSRYQQEVCQAAACRCDQGMKQSVDTPHWFGLTAITAITCTSLLLSVILDCTRPSPSVFQRPLDVLMSPQCDWPFSRCKFCAVDNRTLAWKVLNMDLELVIISFQGSHGL